MTRQQLVKCHVKLRKFEIKYNCINWIYPETRFGTNSLPFGTKSIWRSGVTEQFSKEKSDTSCRCQYFSLCLVKHINPCLALESIRLSLSPSLKEAEIFFNKSKSRFYVTNKMISKNNSHTLITRWCSFLWQPGGLFLVKERTSAHCCTLVVYLCRMSYKNRPLNYAYVSSV